VVNQINVLQLHGGDMWLKISRKVDFLVGECDQPN